MANVYLNKNRESRVSRRLRATSRQGNGNRRRFHFSKSTRPRLSYYTRRRRRRKRPARRSTQKNADFLRFAPFLLPNRVDFVDGAPFSSRRSRPSLTFR